jgi:hypothetical protein
MKEIDITGRRFGRLVALRSLGKGPYWQLHWECRCDCGRLVSVNKNNLIHGHTRSCGCLRRERMKNLNHGKATLGLTDPDGEE